MSAKAPGEMPLAALAAGLPAGACLLGLDLGDRTIGVAISDPGLRIASPLETLRRKKFTRDAGELLKLLDANHAGGLVVGLPLNMDGSEGPRCQSVRQFARNLGKLREGLRYAFVDERLSTRAVERSLRDEADMSRARRGQVVDKAAAAWFLQGALDRLAHEADAEDDGA
jgi:putative Holliday junction resolvase